MHGAASSSSSSSSVRRTLMIFRGGRLGRNKGWQHLFSSKHSLSSLSVVCFSLLLLLLCSSSSLFMRSRRASVRRRACSHKQSRVEEKEVSTFMKMRSFKLTEEEEECKNEQKNLKIFFTSLLTSLASLLCMYRWSCSLQYHVSFI